MEEESEETADQAEEAGNDESSQATKKGPPRPKWLSMKRTMVEFAGGMGLKDFLETLQNKAESLGIQNQEETENGVNVEADNKKFHIGFEDGNNKMDLPDTSLESFEKAAQLILAGGGKGFDLSSLSEQLDKSGSEDKNQVLFNAFSGAKNADPKFLVLGLAENLLKSFQDKTDNLEAEANASMEKP